MNSPSISLEIVEQAKYMNALHAQSLHIKMRDAEGKESESQFSWWSYMYFVAVCRTCVNYNSFVDLEGFLRRLNSLLNTHQVFLQVFLLFLMWLNFVQTMLTSSQCHQQCLPFYVRDVWGGPFGAFRGVLLLHHLQAIFSRSLRITLAFVFAN